MLVNIFEIIISNAESQGHLRGVDEHINLVSFIIDMANVLEY